MVGAYDTWLTVLSVVVAIVASFVALDVPCIGMAAMRVASPIRYQPLLVAISILIAVVASVGALWSAFRLRLDTIGAAFAPDSICTVDSRGIDSIELGWTTGALALATEAVSTHRELHAR